jgi:hypothetical protein
MDNLTDYVGKIVDVDGSRYLLAGIEGGEAILADPDSDGAGDPDTFIHIPAEYLAESMIYLLPGAPHKRWR